MAPELAGQGGMRAFGRVPPPSEKSRGMLNDIRETPAVLRRMIDKHLAKAENGAGGYPAGEEGASKRQRLVDIPSLQRPLPATHKLGGRSPVDIMAACGPSRSGANFSRKFTIIGSGTSYHAALIAEYLIETIARIPVEVQYASEFRYKGEPLMRPGDVFIVVSNSGETADTKEALRMVNKLKDREVLTLAVVNEADSTLGREADAMLHADAGVEVGVASTKAFSAAVAAFTLLAIVLGDQTGQLPAADRVQLEERLRELPDAVQKVLDWEVKPLMQDRPGLSPLQIGECMLWDIGCQNVLAQNFIFLGRGFNFPVALEGAMKCKEVAYIHAEGYPAAEMKHGPIALIDQFMPVVVIAPKADPTYEKIKANIEEVKTRGGSVIAVTEDWNTELADISEYVIRVPSTHEYLMPILAAIPLQLLSWMMGVLRGNEVDAPRGLQKIIGSSTNLDDNCSPRGSPNGTPR